MAFDISSNVTKEPTYRTEEELREGAVEGDIFESIGYPEIYFICVYLYSDYRKEGVSSTQFIRLNSTAVETVYSYHFPLRKLPRGSTVTLTVIR